eukprot:697904-Amphidinium_carterae.1
MSEMLAVHITDGTVGSIKCPQLGCRGEFGASAIRALAPEDCNPCQSVPSQLHATAASCQLPQRPNKVFPKRHAVKDVRKRGVGACARVCTCLCGCGRAPCWLGTLLVVGACDRAKV